MRNPLLPTSVLLAGLRAAGFTSAETQPTLTNGPGAAPAPLRQAQPTPPATSDEYVWLDAKGQPLPMQAKAELEQFLQTARVVKSEKTKHGKFGTRKLWMEKDGVTARAACRMMAYEDRKRQMKDRDVWFFRDHYIHEPAAYVLSELLGLGMVPPAVQRSVNGKPASLQIWVEHSMPEIERDKEGVQPPDSRSHLLQLYQMRVFDNLINNLDRNQGNILFDSEWRVWLIDHSRAFIRDRKLPNPGDVRRVERGFWERLRSVSDEELDAAIKPYLGGPERAALIERRRLLVELIEEKIAQLGEDGILFSW